MALALSLYGLAMSLYGLAMSLYGLAMCGLAMCGLAMCGLAVYLVAWPSAGARSSTFRRLGAREVAFSVSARVSGR